MKPSTYNFYTFNYDPSSPINPLFILTKPHSRQQVVLADQLVVESRANMENDDQAKGWGNDPVNGWYPAQAGDEI